MGVHGRKTVTVFKAISSYKGDIDLDVVDHFGGEQSICADSVWVDKTADKESVEIKGDAFIGGQQRVRDDREVFFLF